MTRGPLLLTSHSNHGLASVPLRNHLRIETRIGFTTLLDAMVLRLPDSSLFWSRSRCGLQPILSWSAPLTSQNDDRGAVSQNYPRIVHKYKYKYKYIYNIDLPTDAKALFLPVHAPFGPSAT